ncbi:MAG: HAD family hydrolase [Spirochaetota bacterium]
MRKGIRIDTDAVGPLQGFLFDLDGTLLDTLGDLADSMNAVLAARGLSVHPLDQYRYFVGDGMRELARRVLPEKAPPDEIIDQVVEEMRLEYGARCYDTTVPYPGIMTMLEVVAAVNRPMAVFSNKPHDFTTQMVKKYFPDIPFHMVLGVGGDVPRKPDPAGALKIARETGIQPEGFFYLGDTATDMRTASAAKMFAAGAAWGFRDEDELRKNGAAIVMQSPDEVTAFIKKMLQ